jgi:hypothetical protein
MLLCGGIFADEMKEIVVVAFPTGPDRFRRPDEDGAGVIFFPD